jgi:hypothetical protein
MTNSSNTLFMQPTYLGDITEDEKKKKNNLYDMMDNDVEAGYRAKIILLRSEGYTVAEIRRQTDIQIYRHTNNHHDNNIRKWIHRFNDYGIDGIVSSRKHNHNHNTPKITDDIEKELLNVFGVYGYTNDKMYTHCYKQKKSSQSVYRFYQ